MYIKLGNKVWYQVCAANTVDFVRTDTSIAGLYVFNSSSTGIDQLVKDDMFSVYPNPTANSILIKSHLSILTYQITNTLGQLIKSDKFTNEPIDISNLKNGIYFITITTSDRKIVSKKILKE